MSGVASYRLPRRTDQEVWGEMAEAEKGPFDKFVDWLLGWKTSFEELRVADAIRHASCCLAHFLSRQWRDLVELGGNR